MGVRLLERRERREPLAYVLGEWGFSRLTLRVDSRVLVPRPETEIVVERCLERLIEVPAPRVLDVGTGSGAIALAIADEHAGAEVTAIDSSAAALEVARVERGGRRGWRTGCASSRHDLADGLSLGAFDLVVSNPPYVRPDEIEQLEPEVRDWEPRPALVGTGVAERDRRSGARVPAPWRLARARVGGRLGSARSRTRSSGSATASVGITRRPGRDRPRRGGAVVLSALLAGDPVVLPTDTVYGLCALPTADALAPASGAEGHAASRSRSRCCAPTSSSLLEHVPRFAAGRSSCCCPGRSR